MSEVTLVRELMTLMEDKVKLQGRVAALQAEVRTFPGCCCSGRSLCRTRLFRC